MTYEKEIKITHNNGSGKMTIPKVIMDNMGIGEKMKMIVKSNKIILEKIEEWVILIDGNIKYGVFESEDLALCHVLQENLNRLGEVEVKKL